jgi:hypothetical protein
MITDLSNTYIKVNSPEESEAVQKKAFELGWDWGNSYGKTISQTDKGGLGFGKGKWICWIVGGVAPSGRAAGFKEITLADLLGEKTQSEEEYNEGDIVVSIVSNNHFSKGAAHYVLKVNRKYLRCRFPNDYWFIQKESVRHATQEEKDYHAIHSDGCIMPAYPSSPPIETNLEKAKRLYPESMHEFVESIQKGFDNGPTLEVPKEESAISGVRSYFSDLCDQAVTLPPIDAFNLQKAFDKAFPKTVSEVFAPIMYETEGEPPREEGNALRYNDRFFMKYRYGIDPAMAFGESVMVDEFGARLPRESHDPTNLKPLNKKLKPMSVKPTPKFNNLVIPKSSKK